MENKIKLTFFKRIFFVVQLNQKFLIANSEAEFWIYTHFDIAKCPQKFNRFKKLKVSFAKKPIVKFPHASHEDFVVLSLALYHALIENVIE